MQFFVIARVAEGVSIEQVLPHVKAEAEAVWQNYSAEIVRSILLVYYYTFIILGYKLLL